MNHYIYAIGFLAQLFFSARILYQWIASERAEKVVSPAAFWIFSLAGSYLMFIYGWLRDDFTILLGQTISYYIYIWNLNKQDVWKHINLVLKIILFITPIAAFAFVFENTETFISTFLKNDKIPLGLILLGSIGQIIFTLRFVYQFIYSARHHQSLLPTGFWLMSLTGSFLIIIYGILRQDPVLIIGQSVGFIAYIRNIMLGFKSKRDLKS